MKKSASPLSIVQEHSDPAAQPAASNGVDMRYLVRALVKYNASDLHLKAGRPPLFRVNGRLVPAKMAQLTAEQVEEILTSTLSVRQMGELEKNLQADFSFRIGDVGRFRCNVFYQKGTLSAVIRLIPVAIPKLDDLGVPAVLKELTQRPRGLILITGATGNGKSTTLAAMVQHMNETRHVHILTIEDPIEYIFRDEKASITQREVGSDAHTFPDALHAGLRQDPDVIVIGELRSMEVIQTALTAAETGHLVLATLHTQSAKTAIERILDVFPGDAQNQIRIQLASSLNAVVSQHLMMRADGTGRIPACEVLVRSPMVESLLLKNELSKLGEVIEGSNSYYKMQSLDRDLARLIQAGLIDKEEALKVATNPDNLKMKLQGLQHREGFVIRSAPPSVPSLPSNKNELEDLEDAG